MPLPPTHAAIGFCSTSRMRDFRSPSAAPRSAPAFVVRVEPLDFIPQRLDPDRAWERVAVEHRQEHEHLVALDHLGRIERVDEGAVGVERLALALVKIALGSDEPGPRAGTLADGSGVVSILIDIDRRRPDAVQLLEVGVVPVERVSLSGGPS